MRARSVLLAFTFILSACVPAVGPPATVEPGEATIGERQTEPVATPGVEEGEPRINVRVDDNNSCSFPQLIPPDGIRPVYDPQFAPASEVDL